MDPVANEVLKELYYDPGSEAAFSGINKLYRAAKESIPTITQSYVDEWLRSQETYRKHRHKKSKFPRLPVIADHVDSIWQLDLLQLLDWAPHNKVKGKPVKFVLVAVDVLSRYGFVEPMSSKTSNDVRDALMRIFHRTGRYPRQIETDQGREFAGPAMKKLYKDLDIVHRWRPPKYKTSICERLIQTIRNRLFKYMEANNTLKYVHVLQDIMDGINQSYHRMLKMRPVDVTKQNEKQAFENLYKQILEKGHIDKPKFEIGDVVNRFLVTHSLTKGSDPQFDTEEVYEVVDVDSRRPPRHVYRIRDYYTKEVIPWSFYAEELIKLPQSVVDGLPEERPQRPKKRKQKRGPGRKKASA